MKKCIIVSCFICALIVLAWLTWDRLILNPRVKAKPMFIELVTPEKIFLNGKLINKQTLITQLKEEIKKYGSSFPIFFKAPNDLDFREVYDFICFIACETCIIGRYHFQSGKNSFTVKLPSGPRRGICVTIFKNHKYAIDGKIVELSELSEKLKPLYKEKLYIYVSYEKDCTYQDFITFAEVATKIGYGLELYSCE